GGDDELPSPDDVDVVQAAEDLGGRGVEVAVRDDLRRTSIVDERVEATEPVNALADEPSRVVENCDIALHVMCDVGAEFGSELLACVHGLHRVDDDAIAIGDEASYDRFPDPRRRA